MTFDSQFYKNFINVDAESLIEAVQGGITIALAASLYYSFYGCILGMSGLVGTILKAQFSNSISYKDYQSRRAFTIICGLVFSSTFVIFMFKQSESDFYPFDSHVIGSKTQLVVGGFLVGIGTQLGSGCTSGHGLCGLPRLSLRSIVAVIIFLITGLISATFNLSNYLKPCPELENFNAPNNISPIYFLIITLLAPLICFIFASHKSFGKLFRTIIYFFIGSIFGMGLMLAGMTKRQKIYGFLELNKNWDPSLFVVLMSGVLINLIIFTIMRKAIKKPIFQQNLSDPRGKIQWKLIIGSFIFGLGWGIGGLCPGPFLLLLPLQNLDIPLFWGVAFIIGMKLTQIMFRQNKLKANDLKINELKVQNSGKENEKKQKQN